VLSEEGLLLVVILVACGLVALGTLELVWPTRPRHPQRRRVPARDPLRRARSRATPPSRVIADPAPLLAAPRPSPPVLPVVSVPAVPDEETAQERPKAETPASVEPEGSVVDRGFALVKTERFVEAATLAQGALDARKSGAIAAPTTSEARETARLWGVVGLAKAGLDDVDGARFAFEEAIALAPRTERLTWERHLIDLALTVGRHALGDVETAPGPARTEVGPERVEALRSAMDWLERGLDLAPDDAGLRATLTAVRGALWLAHEAVLTGLVQRQEFVEARRILSEVMADPECPPDRQGAFRRLLGRTLSGEASQAIAGAIVHVQAGHVDQAMTALSHAQSLIEGIPADALANKRRQELERQGEEVRGLLVRAVGEIVDARAAEIARLIDAGDTSTASLQSEKLWSLLRSGVSQGLAEDHLEDAFGKVRALFDRAGARRP
jgi:hypothetical protein